MNHVNILGGLRSYIGVKDGMYRHIPAEKLGAEVLREVVSRFELPTDAIDYIIGGNAVGGGGNITRLAALSAGFPERISGEINFAASPHRPVRAEIVPGAVVHLLPVGKHPSILTQVIPDRIKLEPALLHHTVLVKIVPVVVDFLPFGHHLAALVEIIPGGSG